MSQTALHNTNTNMNNPLNSYSSFFSSGLLAPHTPRLLHRRDTVNSSDFSDYDADDSFSPSSPDDSMMDVDMSEFVASTLRNPHRQNESERRSATPTLSKEQEGQTTPMQQSPQSMKGGVATSSSASSSTTTTTTTTQPRLRRRRSSLTQATSPMNAIRSPARSAAAAARSRSGSLSLAGAVDAMGAGTYAGRMRSGSCSDSVSNSLAASTSSSSSSGSSALGGASLKVLPPSAFRIRRGARRNYTAPMPALRAPPPTAPLPALPLPLVGIPQQPEPQQQLRPSKLNLNLSMTATSTTATAAAGSLAAPLKSPGLLQSSARARGLSVSSSKLGGNENRIDEEMKEN
ncbi:hypothetical protein M413DRAFT_192538 [Hebeloma cylindrosporum]|uniref:Uncharacterized protein n=1 Tax=Hebeloma cylindrosporum TaxID=76867 RepID=A0A0C3C5H9_HEBCY|nr:hypothetical protein M413DRAFT_192538 [Hebeloma cylindrosporum h7]